jgi:hypothetical protein
MKFNTILRPVASFLLVSLLVVATWAAVNADRAGYFSTDDWVHAFCLAQTILLAAWAVYGPGRFELRLPFIVAWGLIVGFALARANLISTGGRTSLAAGAILVATGILPSLTLFSLHRWRTGATMIYGAASAGRAAISKHQLSLRMLMVMMTAFAIAGVVARTAITAAPDPFAHEHDKFFMHAWLAFIPCLASAPMLLVFFRPTWTFGVLAGCFILLLSFVEPFAFGIFVRLTFENKNLANAISWDSTPEAILYSLMWQGQTFIATAGYAILIRAAGFRLVVPDQSNDKNPNPSGQPATDAGCVQD